MKGLLIVSLFAGIENLRAQSTAFTYQGLLNVSNSPATGSYDLAFTLYATNAPATNTVAVAGPLTNLDTAVSNGLFTVSLNFSNITFLGTNYWVQINAATNGDTNLLPLLPLLPITPTPYAISAGTAGTLLGSLPLSQLPAAVLTNSASNVTLTGTFSGNGTGLTNVTAVATNVPTLTAGSGIIIVTNGSPITNYTISRTNGGGVQTDYTNTWTGTNTFTNTVIATNAAAFNQFAGTFSGNGAGLTNLPAQVLSSTYTNAVNFSNSADVFAGDGAGLTNVTAAGLTGTNSSAVSFTNAGNVFVGSGAGLTSLNASQLTGGPWTNASVAGIANSSAYNQSNPVTSAFATISTNAHLHLTDEWGTTYNTHTNGALTIVMTNGNTLNWSNGGLTLSSNASYLSYSNGNLSVSGGFVGDGSALTNVTATALSGTYSAPVFLTNTANIFDGNGGGLTNLAAASIEPGSAGISISGNAATATYATNAGTAILASNLVSGISITNAIITNTVFSGDGGGLTNLLLTNAAPSLPANFGAMAFNTYYTNTWGRPAFVSVQFASGSDTISNAFYLFSTNSYAFPPVVVAAGAYNSVRDFLLPPNWWFSITNYDSAASGISTNYVILQ